MHLINSLLQNYWPKYYIRHYEIDFFFKTNCRIWRFNVIVNFCFGSNSQCVSIGPSDGFAPNRSSLKELDAKYHRLFQYEKSITS